MWGSKTRIPAVNFHIALYEETSNEKIYYKLSTYDAWNGSVGHECVNEIIADHLLTIWGMEHLRYQIRLGWRKRTIGFDTNT